MTTWVGTFRSLFLGRWWWLPPVFFAPSWLFSVILLFFTGLALLLSILTAGSNGPLLIGLVLTGVWVGSWARQLHHWECAVLLPYLPRHLFALSLSIVVGVVVVFAAVSVYAGNALPALGPALLVGMGGVYCLVRLPEWAVALMAVGVPWLFLVWFSTWGAGWTAVYWEEMSDPAVQAPAVAFALALLAILKRRLESPVIGHRSSMALGPTPAGGIRGTSVLVKRLCGLALVGFALDMLVRLFSDYPYLSFLEPGEPGLRYDGLFVTAGMIIACPLALLNVHEFPAPWLMGTGETRPRLARYLVGRMVVAGALPLLAIFLAVEAIQSVLTGAEPRYDPLLESQILAFLALGLAYAFRRTYPNRFLTHVHLVNVVMLWRLGEELSRWFDMGMPLLVLLVIGCAIAAIYAVGHSLARANYVL